MLKTGEAWIDGKMVMGGGIGGIIIILLFTLLGGEPGRIN